jgi:ribosomal protein L37E
MKRPRVRQNRKKFLDFLLSKRAKMVCEVCGAQAWAVAEPDQGLMTAFPVMVGGGASFGTSMVMYVAICTNCGHTRLHSAVTVDEGAQPEA